MRKILLVAYLSSLPVVASAQQIIGVTPYTGLYSGNQSVQIRGSGLLPPCGTTCFPQSVLFGTIAVEVLSWTDSAIDVRTPAHRPGAVDVTVRARNGQAVVAPSAFSFITGDLEEQVLLPLLMVERPGAYGSRWRTHLTIRNSFESPATISPYALTIPPGGVLRDPGEMMPPLSDPIPARMLFVRRDSEDLLNIQLRAQDVSRQGETWGVELPVVRERDFRVAPLSLLDVPTSRAFRIALRIYALDRFDQFGNARHDFLVRLYDLSTNALLAEDVVTAAVSEPIVTPARPVTRPAMFQTFDLVAAMPSIGGAERIRIEVSPVSLQPVVPPPVSLFWALVSVTHNETQTVTLVTPD